MLNAMMAMRVLPRAVMHHDTLRRALTTLMLKQVRSDDIEAARRTMDRLTRDMQRRPSVAMFNVLIQGYSDVVCLFQ